MAVGQGLTGLARNYAAEFIAQGVERDARDELYASLLGKSQTFHGRQRIGDIMARATNDVHMLNLMFSPGLMLITDSLMGTIVPILIIARLRFELLLVPAIFLVLLAITLADYNRKLNPVSIAMRDQFGTMNAGLAEAIAGIEVVKANVRERYEWDKFVHNARLYRDHFVRQGEIQAVYLPMLMFSLCWAGALLHALLIWRAGNLSLGQVVTFMGLMGVLRFPTFISIFSFNLVQLGIASAERILELINTETELDENEGGMARPIQGAVTFEHVTFSYRRHSRCSKTSALRPNRVRRLRLWGRPAPARPPSPGSSTASLMPIAAGCWWTGWTCATGAWNRFARKSRRLSRMCFSFPARWPKTSPSAAPTPRQAEIERAAGEAQAHEFITGFNDGYNTEVGERGVTLSGGQRQRIAIARAFLTDPRILILDDSTSAIDSATEDQIQRAMRRISRERTTFLITHRLSQIRWADRILVLRRGELVDQGTHEELLARSPDYRRIFARYD